MRVLLVLLFMVNFNSYALSKKDYKKCSKIFKKWKNNKAEKLTKKLEDLKCLEEEEFQFEFKQAYNGDISKLAKEKTLKELYTSKKLMKKTMGYVYDDCIMRK